MPTNNAYNKMSRTNRGGAMDTGAVQSTQANHYSGGHKVLEVGPEFMKQVGNTYCSGRDVSADGNSVYPGSALYFYNNSSSVAWVALGTAQPAAPTGFSNGIPLAPNAWTRLSAGENTFVKSSASTVGMYEVKDDTQIIAEN